MCGSPYQQLALLVRHGVSKQAQFPAAQRQRSLLCYHRQTTVQEERAKGTDWGSVQYARRVINLFDRERRDEERLSFAVPCSGQQGLDWITHKLGVAWFMAMEEPEFKTHQPISGGPKTLVHSYAYGSNWKARILNRILLIRLSAPQRDLPFDLLQVR